LNSKDRLDIFDQWAEHYDKSVLQEDDFPFAGYDQVLEWIVQIAAPEQGQSILDLGIGTGNLASRFKETGCEIWGVDFSTNMLKAAREKVPEAHLIQADLNSDLQSVLTESFSRIVSSYALHEFNLPDKLQIIKGLAENTLSADGLFVIGDISFPTVADRNRGREFWIDRWDHSEFYWAADEAREAFKKAGFSINYWQVSVCGGVYQINRGDAILAP
jgi:putative AdoMet-dependent methyltransferase